MPIYQTAHYRVNPGAVDNVKAAIAEFVAYVTEHEPGTPVALTEIPDLSDQVTEPQ